MTSVTTDRLSGVNASLAIKSPCVVASTADLTLSGTQTIDGVAVVADDRVLVKDQSTTTENGIYVVASGSWTRALDFDGTRDVVTGTLVAVVSGTTNADTFWRVSSTGDITIDTDAITFEASNTSLAGVSAFGASLIDDTTAAIARATLGLIIGTHVLAPAGDGSNLTGLHKQGVQTIWVPASAMKASTTDGASGLTTVETTAGNPDLNVFDFATDADDYVQFTIGMPKNWDEGVINAQFYWTSTATDTDGVTWGIQGIALSDNASIDTAFSGGTPQIIDDANQSAAEELLITAETPDITIGGTPAAGDLCFFRVFRDVSDSNDTAAEAARLLGVKLLYTTNAADDS